MTTNMQKILHLYILVDRTGSMARHWNHTINTLNEYMNGLKKSGKDIRVNMAFFDKNSYSSTLYSISNNFSLNLLSEPILQHRYVDAKEWAELSSSDKSIEPRGMTPLYDAICEYGALPKAKGLKKTDLVQFIIITDGDENVSSKHTLDDAKKILAKFEKKNWPVVYLGANLEAFKGGTKIVSSMDTIADYNPINWNETAVAMAGSTMRYMATSSATSANLLDSERKSIK